MNEKYQRELLLLAEGLIKRGIQFGFRDISDGGQIIVYKKTAHPYEYTNNLRRRWDAICHSYSYGHEQGLLELMGTLVDDVKCNNLVEGWLTAKEILKRVDKEALENESI